MVCVHREFMTDFKGPVVLLFVPHQYSPPAYLCRHLPLLLPAHPHTSVDLFHLFLPAHLHTSVDIFPCYCLPTRIPL